MPLVDYDQAGNIGSAAPNAPLSHSQSAHQITPTCPSWARRKAKPDLVVLYKLQQAKLQQEELQQAGPQQLGSPLEPQHLQQQPEQQLEQQLEQHNQQPLEKASAADRKRGGETAAPGAGSELSNNGAAIAPQPKRRRKAPRVHI